MSIQTYPLEKAIELSKTWDLKQKDYFESGSQLNSVIISKETVEAILAHPGCASIRIHFGLNELNEVKPFAVGLDSQDVEIIPSTSSGNKFVYNYMRPCPPFHAPKKKFHLMEDASDI